MYPNLSDFARKARSGEALAVVFFGGSLTWGANATDPNRTSLRGRLMQFLRKSFPLARWTFVDSAIGGAGSTMAVYRVSRDVLAHAPDLVFMDFSVNDGLSSDADLAAAAYEGILRHILAGAPGCALVPLILPTQDAVLLPDTSSLRRVTLHHALAGHYALPCIDILQGLRDRHRAGTVDLKSVWPPELFDTCHPHDAGYAAYAEIVQAVLEPLLADQPASAAVDLPSEWFGPRTYASVLRRRIAEAPSLPSGWRTGFASLRAGTFDFLSSRWMDGLVMAENFQQTGWNDRPLTGVSPAPLRIRFRGAVVHLLGESTDLSGKVELHLDGQCLRTVDAGAFGRQFAPSAYLNLPVASGLDPAVDHLLEIRPVSDPATPCELRLESVCVASPDDVAVTFEPSGTSNAADLATGTPGHIEACASPGSGSIDVNASPDELAAAIQGVLDAGRVGEDLLDIQRLLEQQRGSRRRVQRQAVEVVDELCHVVLGEHLFEALDRALGGGADAVDLHRAGEPREEGAVGQPHRQLAHGESGDGQQDRVAQGLARDLRAKAPLALAVLLGAGAQMAPHEGVLQAGLRQNPIHRDERVAEVAVVFCAKNARKCWTEIGLKWYGIHVFYLSLSL